PASFAQRRMWFLHELEGSSQYNVVKVKKISGPLDGSILQRCIDEIVRRHESLRTIFLSRSGELVQFIVESLDLTVQVNDLSVLPEYGREAEVKQAISHEANVEFDLECGPLLHAKLLRLGDREHVLVIVMHHIVTDGWSKSVLFRELSALYEAYARGLNSPLHDLPIQYGDYAVWQHHWFQGETLENQLGYWREQLGSLEMLTLPTDYPRPVTQSFRGAQKHFLISNDLAQKLKALSARAKGTLYMTLLGAFQVLLHRYSGQDDIIVGSPIAGRGHLELEGLIGCFVNTLVMRTDLSGDPTFEELLCRVRETAVGAYTHQDLPFEKLVEELVSERDLSRNPIFQVMLNLQIAQESSVRLADALMDEFKRERENVKLDLGLELTQSDDGFNGILEYSRDLFEASTIDRMSGHLLTLLRGIVKQPWARLSELPILTQTERQKLLVDWNSNSIDIPSQQGIHTLFEEQAEHSADSVALVWDKQAISYRELNRRANQLAHYLKRQGVGPEMIVGICMERGIDMVVGLLAILKAGAAYVPMD
ncbi:MAG: condensation domain-containing protein, partial [Arenicellales bacterium]